MSVYYRGIALLKAKPEIWKVECSTFLREKKKTENVNFFLSVESCIFSLYSRVRGNFPDGTINHYFNPILVFLTC